MIAAALLSLLICTVTAQLQCASTNQTYPTCPVSFGGFHLICGEFSTQDAQSTCTAYGQRLASLTDTNVLDALYTLQDCLDGSAWIASWNGYGADPCAYLESTGGAIVSLGWQGCSALKAILCQDIPVETTTLIATQSDVVTHGIATTTTTACSACNRPRSANLDNKRATPGKCDRSRPSSCHHDIHPHCQLGRCAPVCPVTVCGLHVVQAANLTFADASEECSKYGWHLADLTSGQYEDAVFLQKYCGRAADDYGLWVRSYNGIDGGQCVRAMHKPDDLQFSWSLPVGFGVESSWCQQRPAFALCQDAAPAPTAYGNFDGVVSFAIDAFTTTLSTTVPSSTVTVTVTRVFQ